MTRREFLKSKRVLTEFKKEYIRQKPIWFKTLTHWGPNRDRLYYSENESAERYLKRNNTSQFIALAFDWSKIENKNIDWGALNSEFMKLY